MCNHSLQSPYVILSHCAPVLETGLFSSCKAIQLIDQAPSYESTFERPPPHKPTLEPILESDDEDEEAPSIRSAAESIWDDDEVRTETSANESVRRDEESPSSRDVIESVGEDEDENEAPPRGTHATAILLFSTGAALLPSSPGVVPLPSGTDAAILLYSTGAAPLRLPNTDAASYAPALSATPPLTPNNNNNNNNNNDDDDKTPPSRSAADRLHTTTIRWQLEDMERGTREAEEAGKPWIARKIRRGVRKAREARRKWVEGWRERREKMWWEWQVWLVE